jgi:hypothetical protein
MQARLREVCKGLRVELIDPAEPPKLAFPPVKIAVVILVPDIEQPLTGRNLIKPTDLFPKQAKDFDLHLV